MNISRAVRLSFWVAVASFAGGCSPGFQLKLNTFQSSSQDSQLDVLPQIVAKTCGASFAPKKVSVHLLSNNEYNNSVSDLLYTSSNASDLAIFEARAVGPSGFSNDTSTVAISDLTISKYWDAAVVLANEVIASKNLASGAYSKIASCAVGATTVSSTCVDTIVRQLALRAWRKPASETADNNELQHLRDVITSSATFDDGLGNLIKAILISPNFLFVSINSPEATQDGVVFNLDPYQLASRLSYFLWQSIPDSQLLSLASSGELTKATILQAQVQRMLKDPKINRLTSSMANEWAHLSSLSTLPTPGLDDTLKAAMLTETQMLFQDVVQNDLSLSTLTTAKYSFLNKALADYYGVAFSGADPNAFYRTSLASTERIGIFGRASFLILSAGSPTETRPVKRGKVIANDWVCADVPPPPPNVQSAGDLSALPANATPRDMLAVHTNSASCIGCHRILDPYGLALETFDPFGKPRTVYSALGNAPIDPSGVLPNGFSFDTTAKLLTYISDGQETKTCLVRKVMGLALTRAAANVDDKCVAEVTGSNLLQSTSKFSEVVQAIVTSRQFQMQTGEAP